MRYDKSLVRLVGPFSGPNVWPWIIFYTSFTCVFPVHVWCGYLTLCLIKGVLAVLYLGV